MMKNGLERFCIVEDVPEAFRNMLGVSGKSDILLSLQRTSWAFLDPGIGVPVTELAQVVA